MDKKAIMSSGNRLCTKKDIMRMIDRNFPNDEVNMHDNIAVITTITSKDGSVYQTITFSKILE